MKTVLPLLFIFSGCSVGPKYHKPEMAIPTSFEESKSEEASNLSLAGWWKGFNDPVLDSFIEEALVNNYDLRIAIEKIEQTRAQYRIEKSHLWPEIDLNATALRTRISRNLFSPPPQAQGNSGLLPGFLNIFQVGFDAIWELDFFGKFRHGKKAAYYQWEATKEEAESVLISMLSEVAISYVNIRALQNKIALAQEKIQIDEQQLAIIESLFEVGIDNQLQITKLISTLESDKALIPILETSFKQTIYALAYLLGRAPEDLLPLLSESRRVPAANNKVPIGLPSDLLRRRPDVKSAERQLASATEQIGMAIADYFPHFALNGIGFGAGNQAASSIAFESNSLGSLLSSMSRMFSLGIGINWDLLDFGRVRGKVNVQKSLQKQALLTYEKTVIASLKDVESALVAYFEEHNRKDLLMKKITADRRSLQIIQGLHSVGLNNEMEVLEMRKVLLEAENQVIESEQALAGDLIALYKALGGEWDAL